MYTCIFHFITTSHKIERLRRASFYANIKAMCKKKREKTNRHWFVWNGLIQWWSKVQTTHPRDMTPPDPWEEICTKLNSLVNERRAVRSAWEKRLSYLLPCHKKDAEETYMSLGKTFHVSILANATLAQQSSLERNEITFSKYNILKTFFKHLCLIFLQCSLSKKS